MVWETQFLERTQRDRFKLNSWRTKLKKFSLCIRQKHFMVTWSLMTFEMVACVSFCCVSLEWPRLYVILHYWGCFFYTLLTPLWPSPLPVECTSCPLVPWGMSPMPTSLSKNMLLRPKCSALFLPRLRNSRSKFSDACIVFSCILITNV